MVIVLINEHLSKKQKDLLAQLNFSNGCMREMSAQEESIESFPEIVKKFKDFLQFFVFNPIFGIAN